MKETYKKAKCILVMNGDFCRGIRFVTEDNKYLGLVLTGKLSETVLLS